LHIFTALSFIRVSSESITGQREILAIDDLLFHVWPMLPIRLLLVSTTGKLYIVYFKLRPLYSNGSYSNRYTCSFPYTIQSLEFES